MSLYVGKMNQSHASPENEKPTTQNSKSEITGALIH